MKAALLSALVLTPGVLGAFEIGAIQGITHDAPHDLAAELVDDIRRGRATLAHIDRDGARVGFLVYTVDAPELVIHAAFGPDGRARLLPDLIGPEATVVDDLATSHACRSVRFHTTRPGLVNRALACGFRISEVVLRREVIR